MLRTVKKFTILIIFLFQCSGIYAQLSPSPSEGYAYDLGAVIAEVRGAQSIADICAEQFPDLRSKNQNSVDNWRDRYKPFIAEMNSRFDALPKYWATKHSRGAEATPEYWVAFLDKQLNAAREIVKQQFRTLEPEKKRLVCVSFSQSLTSERWNLESFHKSKVATIRRGPD